MRFTTRQNSRAARRARCPKRKEKREKVGALVPTPTLPDAYALGEIQTPELLLLNARQLPAIETEPGSVPQSGAGSWWTLRLRRTLVSRWMPQIKRREGIYGPQPELPEHTEERPRSFPGLGEAIREIREEYYLDGSQLAKEADLPHWRLTAIEESRLSMDVEVLVKLARAIGISTAVLIERAEEISTAGAR